MFALICSIILTTHSAGAAVTCLFEAQNEARAFSAQKNGYKMDKIQVVDFAFLSETPKTLQYAIKLNTQEALHLTLSSRDCALLAIEINF